ncbi:MAG: type I secretion system permease/ATPase [Limnohabitans sp.]
MNTAQAPHTLPQPSNGPTQLMSRLAGLLGHAVPPHRFLLDAADNEHLANASGEERVRHLWLTRFPEGEVRACASDPGADDYPALWVPVDDQPCLLLRGRLASGLLIAEDAAGHAEELPRERLGAGSWLVLSTAMSAEHGSMSDAQTRSASGWFRHAMWQRKRVFIEGMVATMSASVFGLLTSLYTMQVYDRVVPTKGYSTLWVLTIGVMLAIIMELLMRQVRTRLVERACKAIDEELSSVFFGQALAIRMEHRPRSVGTFASQIRQFESVRTFLSSATLFVIADLPFALFFVAVMAMIAGPIAIVPLIFIPMSLLTGLAFKRSLKSQMEARITEANMKNGLLVESIDGIESIKAAGGEWKMLHRWRQLTRVGSERELLIRDLSSLSASMTQTLQQVSYVALIAAGAYAIGAGELTVGGLIACSIISGRALAPIAQISSFMLQWQHAQIALQALDAMMALPRDDEPTQRYLVPETCNGHLRLEDVQFGDREKTILSVPSLNIAAGERVAVLGSVGSGKSTLLKLLSGLYRPNSGRVFLDGIDMVQLAHEHVRQHIGYLPQDVRLFHGTLRDNLVLGLPAPSDSEILDCARITGLDRVIQAHPRGLGLEITEGGRGLSGGQRQLVGITRLLLARPRVLLLDEPSASMDTQLEQQFVQKVLTQAAAGMTLVVATHKPALLAVCTRVVIVERGQIVANGPRDEVLTQLRNALKTTQSTPPTAVGAIAA